MNLFPVIERELRVASRQQASWHLRLAFATGAVLACVFGLLLPHPFPQNRGQVVLVCLVVSGLALSLFAGAYLTADSVSAEKREGTLGLLFLTPLTGWQIVLGKMLGHSLQVGCAWMATFPVFFLSLLHGGVIWAEVTRILLALLLTLLLSLACGMFWSTLCTEARSSVMATAASMLVLNFLPWLPALFQTVILNRSGQLGSVAGSVAALSPMTMVVMAFETNYRLAVSPPWTLARGDALFWSSALLSIALSVGSVAVAGWRLPRLWRLAEAGGNDFQPKRGRAWVARLGARRETRWSDAAGPPSLWAASRELGENAGMRALRRLTLGVFGLMLVASVTTGHWEEGFISAMGAAYALHLLTRLQAALAVTRRLSEDRRSGALELLLVTPVAESEIVEAHRCSLRLAFRRPYRSLLAINLILQAMIFVFSKPLHIGREWAVFTVFFTGGLLITVADFRALSWLGLRASLRATSQLRAAGSALAQLVGLPWLGFAVTFLAAIQSRNLLDVGACFAVWAVGCLLFDAWLAGRSRRWLAVGLRRRVSEAG